MRRSLCVAIFLLGLPVVRAGAQTVTAPSAAVSVASANDFATRVFQDPWDMNERTDLGWWLNSVDSPSHGFSSFNFAGGLFSGVAAADPNVWLLETGLPNLPPIGKYGSTFPLNADQYRMFAVRMRVSQPGYFMFLWSTNTMYDGLTPSGPVYTTPGWRIYFVDLATLGAWNGTKRSLRFDPAPDNTPAGSTIDIDWIRLVDNQPSLFQTIEWTSAGGPVDIYLDNDNSPTSDPDQTLGLIASGVAGTSYPLNVGALPPGNYYVGIRRTGTTGALAYSTGLYQVNAPATLTVTAPSEEGSADDFATVQLNNPWDMTTALDVDTTINVTNAGVATVPTAETESGTPLGNITAFAGTSTLGNGTGACGFFQKPVVYPLRFDFRGAVHHIDPNRYRILTVDLGLPNKARDLCGGSIVRVVWRVAGDAQETYSWGIPLNSRVGANVLNRINVDMADRTMLPIDAGAASLTGWVPGSSAFPGIESFRIDPHEFGNPTSFYIQRVKLAALETAHTEYTVRWTSSRTGGTVNVYYDTDKDPSSMTLIGGTSASSTTGALTWDTSSLPQGARYYVYVEFDDGLNVNGAYGKWPIEINHSPISSSRIALNRSTLNFGVTAATVKTPAQIIRLTTLGGFPCWNAVSDLNFVVVSPSAGCGSALLTVSLANQSYNSVSDFSGYIRVTSAEVGNSPQVVRTVVRTRNSSSPPSGVVDTPANGVGVTGSLAVTGWAIDDIGVSRVTICRDPLAGEAGAHPACGAGQIYIGDAVSIDDARPDLEAYSPNTPLNYRAGWGFLVLTNTLPSQGNGAFTLYVYAFDTEGQRAAIGSRVIYAQNATATEPFGTIDTPGQGDTVSGATYSNFGWVLSRVRRADPPGGGSVTAYVDGVAVGNPCCWTQRSDLSATFPGYPGIDTALGILGLNTFAFGNGIHTIVWVATDNGGVSSGLGSRYFSVFNAGDSATLASATRPAGPDLGRRVQDLGGIESRSPVAVREGFRLTGERQQIAPGLDGTRRIWTSVRGRIELQLKPRGGESQGGDYAGYLLVGGILRELPTGSSFDPARGAFYWQPGLGYLGDYELLFVRTSSEGARERIPVRVTLQPVTERLSTLARAWSGVDFSR